MRGDALYDRDTERAALRLRLAAAALATTLTFFAGERADPLAVATIPILLAAAVVLRYAAPGRARRWRTLIGGALDVVLATAIVYALPLHEPAWILFGFAIAIATLHHGAMGTFAATAASVVAYDAALALRAAEADIAALWIVQALIAVGLIVAELAWTSLRTSTDRQRVRRHAHALRAFGAAHTVQAALDALRMQILALGALEVTYGGDADALRRSLAGRRGIVERLPTRDAMHVAIALPADPAENAVVETGARDLIADLAPILAEAERLAHVQRLLEATATALDALTRTARETTEAGALAALTVAATKVAGRAAIVRLADGAVLTGDVQAAAAAELARGGGTAALLPARGASWSAPLLAKLDARSAIVVSAGQGRALLALSGDRDLSDEELTLLQRLAAGAGATADVARERDRLRDETAKLRTETERLGGVIQQREDAVALAAHELRNPLTSVHGYATLMARNLGAVQEQLTRLERIIADLLGRSAFDTDATADVARVTREASGRLRTITGRDAAVYAPDTQVLARIDPVRLSQVLDNLLRNAVKYSPAGSPIEVEIDATEDEVSLVVRDHGAGIAADELERVFERGYRSPRLADRAGEGLGLTVCRQIVDAQGGRIWVTSDGPDRGSAFHVALPRAHAVAAEQRIGGSD